MKIVFLSHTAATSVFRVGSHHLAREFARSGAQVAHISTPLSLLHLLRRDEETSARLRVARSPNRPSEDGVVHIVPLVAAPLGRVPAWVGRLQARLPLRPFGRGWLRPWREADVLFVDQPLLEPLVELLSPRRVVYRPTDAHYDPRSRAAELKLLSYADAVVAMSPRVLDEVLDGASARPRATYFENGVDYARFARGDEGPGSGLVYLGALDKRFDWALVTALARRFPNTTLAIVGPPGDGVPDGLPENVELVGPVPYEQAPEALRRAAVGLLPFSDDPSNQGRSPMKYYEYLAAGLYVVARSSPTLEARSAPGVWLYNDEAGAVRSVEEALHAAVAARNDAGRVAAAAHSWEAIARDMLRFALEDK
jgi:teichuronic acid biosynthesis glycosyltransferase TuaH